MSLIITSEAAPKVMVLGDSMSREYEYLLTFSSPDSDPTEANTMNWVEILAARRGSDIDFGDEKDYGYEYNYSIPGADTDRWMQVLDPSSGKLEEYLFNVAVRDAMRGDYSHMDVIVIMLGGNDANFEYGNLYNSTPGSAVATSFIANVIANLNTLLDDIESHTTTLPPIVLANTPDVGGTPDIINDHPDPAKRANASAIIADLNQAMATLATNRGLILAPISNLTDVIVSNDPFYIGAIEMIKDKHPENPPKYLFCKGGLHPSTNGQAIIANTLLAAINTATNPNIPLLPDREILADVMGLDPDEPYNDWAAAAGLTDTSMTADKDGDGIPNLGEYLLALDPLTIDHIHLASVQEDGGTSMLTLDFNPDPTSARLADTMVTQSNDLSNWTPVPAANLIETAPGSYQARMPLGPGLGFFRMEFKLKP